MTTHKTETDDSEEKEIKKTNQDRLKTQECKQGRIINIGTLRAKLEDLAEGNILKINGRRELIFYVNRTLYVSGGYEELRIIPAPAGVIGTLYSDGRLPGLIEEPMIIRVTSYRVWDVPNNNVILDPDHIDILTSRLVLKVHKFFGFLPALSFLHAYTKLRKAGLSEGDD